MNSADIRTLQANINETVRILTCDGESMLAKVVLVSEDDADLLYELITTNRESHYEKFGKQATYRIAFHEIKRVEELTAPPQSHRDTPDPS